MPKLPHHTLLLCLLFSTATATGTQLDSPAGAFQITFSVGDNGRPQYQINHNQCETISPSGLGFITSGGQDFTTGFQPPTLSPVTTHNETWSPVWGERSTVRDHYKTTTVTFLPTLPSSTSLQLEVRAYDQGVAFRYALPAANDPSEIKIQSEQTEFHFPADHHLWAVYSAQGKYSKEKISTIRNSVERPVVLETTGGKSIAIAEAALVDYARMRLKRSTTSPHTLVSNLHSPVTTPLPAKTPWRVVMAADSPGQLLENNDLLLNLNEPNQIADTSWIRPGKVIREVSLSTAGAIACVDFAVANGLQFIEFDAGWYGPERDPGHDARTVSKRGLDLPAAIAYARQHNIGVIVYVNRIHLERDLDDLLPLYKKWGIAGIKYGFVQHGSQKWTAWLHDAITKTAGYGMMVDVHDEYRMTGWQRTYPNFMTAEGIGGDETRPPNRQALANLFNRMIASPADHTFCYYNGYVDDTTSHAAQLAKTVCFFSPWQFLFWYDRPSNASGEPELGFFKHLPTTWDDTRVLHGSIGEFATIARRRGGEWWLGSLNAGRPRTLPVALDFLDPDKTYQAYIYTDDPDTPTKTKVAIEQRQVTSTSTIEATMGAQGGVAVRLTPEK